MMIEFKAQLVSRYLVNDDDDDKEEKTFRPATSRIIYNSPSLLHPAKFYHSARLAWHSIASSVDMHYRRKPTARTLWLAHTSVR